MNSTPKKVPGLAVRQLAAARLARVLKGAPFVPFDAGDVAEGRDRALANRLVSVALRRHGQLSVLLKQHLKKGLPKRSGLFEAGLRVGLTEIVFLEPEAAHAGVHLAVETIKNDQRGRPFAGLANAVLRTVARTEGLAATLRQSRASLLPEGLAAGWREIYGAEAVNAMAGALLEGAPLDLTGRAGFAPPPGQKILGPTYRLMERDRRIEELDGFGDGNWWVQDVAAAIPARLLNVKPGETVADLCAAPGGKTAQLASAGGQVTAVENNPDRLVRLEKNLARLKLDVKLVLADGAKSGAAASFDKVLADLPCAATGTFRRHPEVLWRQDQTDRAVSGGFLGGLQKKILANGGRLVRKGGVLVFCTCSLAPEEGEDLAAWFLSEFSQFEVVPIAAEELEGWDTPVNADGFLRTVPGMALPGKTKPDSAKGTLDGFFAARFARRG
jgi:16S rRNA (cytosine967-C5)-methyltransferase